MSDRSLHPGLTRCTMVLMAGLAIGCSKQAPSPSPSSAQSSQTFDFAAQPVAFSPPPSPWEAQAEQSGGIRGVRYVKRNSVGEAIGVGNYYDVSRRLRGAQIARLLDTDSNIRNLSFDQAMRDAWCATENPYSDLEAEVASKVNAALNRVVVARRERDYDNVRRELSAAQEDAERLHFTFGEVIDRALFNPETTSDPSRYHFVKRRDTTIAGEPGVVLDYTLELREGRRYLRKAYVMRNDHLFVAEFIGLEGSLAEFDKVVASISFPP